MSEITREAEVCSHCGTDKRDMARLTRERDIANLALRDLAEGVDLHQCLVARPHEGILACRIDSPNRGCHACRIAGTIATLIRERDEARADAARLRGDIETALEMLRDSWGEDAIAGGDDQVAVVLQRALAGEGEVKP